MVSMVVSAMVFLALWRVRAGGSRQALRRRRFSSWRVKTRGSRQLQINTSVRRLNRKRSGLARSLGVLTVQDAEDFKKCRLGSVEAVAGGPAPPLIGSSSLHGLERPVEDAGDGVRDHCDGRSHGHVVRCVRTLRPLQSDAPNLVAPPKPLEQSTQTGDVRGLELGEHAHR
jgi:hypothetical protein